MNEENKKQLDLIVNYDTALGSFAIVDYDAQKKAFEDFVNGLEVKGHANFAEHGKDLVCAGVSCIITGGFNALNKEDVEEITLEEGYAKVVVKPESKSIDVINVILIQLQTIQESYPKFIKIK